MTAPRRGGILREGYDYDFSRADPATGAHVDPSWCAIYETLVVADPEGRLGPMLAESWQADPDGLAWRFRIRPDARFQSGERCDEPGCGPGPRRNGLGGVHMSIIASPGASRTASVLTFR